MAKANGYILYRGPSVLDGAPIIVIATMETSNVKTGNMVQTWIMREDIAPHHATKTGEDASVCGDCVHRPANQGSCYVTVFQAPLSVWKAYHRGAYSTDVEEFKIRLRGRKLRVGAYGDGAAVPTGVWLPLVDAADGHTGYTHQSNHANFDPAMLKITMVSADTAKQAERLAKYGVRYFRTKRPTDPVLAGEVECLSDSVGKACADCLLCDGSGRGKGKSVYITIHGSKAANYNPDIIAIA
jgi:putative component of toxin-antitoxin plasmid stabilization module